MVARALTRSIVALIAVALLTAFVSAQTPAPKAGDVYLAYLADMAKAKKFEDVSKYMSAKNLAEMKKTPPAELPKMFEFIKMMVTSNTNVKVVKETPTATGATLSVEGIGDDKAKHTGTVDMIKEGAAWKVGNETWK